MIHRLIVDDLMSQMTDHRLEEGLDMKEEDQTSQMIRILMIDRQLEEGRDAEDQKTLKILLMKDEGHEDQRNLRTPTLKIDHLMAEDREEANQEGGQMISIALMIVPMTLLMIGHLDAGDQNTKMMSQIPQTRPTIKSPEDVQDILIERDLKSQTIQIHQTRLIVESLGNLRRARKVQSVPMEGIQMAPTHMVKVLLRMIVASQMAHILMVKVQ